MLYVNMSSVPNDSSWGVVISEDIGITDLEVCKGKFLVYGSADPLPNPGELLLIESVASELGTWDWNFFVYGHGKNLPMEVPEGWCPPPGIFYLEKIIPQGLTLREMAEAVFRLRREPVILAHMPNGRHLRATSHVKEVPDITISDLHEQGGWLGGSAIHYLLRLWAEKHPEIIYICPYQQKGRVYRVYRGVVRPLFVLVPFVRLCPPPGLAPGGWEPLPWGIWRVLSSRARRIARQWVCREIKKFFRSGEPLRIELKWEWWL